MNNKDKEQEVLMNLILQEEKGSLFEMTNLTPKRTGLSVDIWSDHDGVEGNYQHNEPRVKIGKRGQYEVEVTIEEQPQILSKTPNIKQSEYAKINKAIKYASRNYDLFLKHFNDTTYEFDDDDLKDALRERGDYK